MKFSELFKKNNNKNGNNPFDVEVNKATLHKNLEFTASEQYRLLRTNIKFTIPEDIKCPIIGVASSIRGEGKSTTSVNLAYVLAERGNKTLLIDGDLRLPSIAKKLEIDGAPGVTDLLLGADIDIESFKSDIHEKWYIMPSGEIPPNPSELLGSKRMSRLLARLQEHFDYIVLDLPPINIVSDAISVSNSLTGMVLVVREDYVTKKDLEQCIRQIELANVNLLGCVMNESEQNSAHYSKYGKYKKYKYYKYSSYGDESASDENAGIAKETKKEDKKEVKKASKKEGKK